MKRYRSNVILALHRHALGNLLIGLFSGRPAEAMCISIAALALLLYQGAAAYDAMANCVACQAAFHHPGLPASAILIATAFMSGLGAGRFVAGRLLDAASSPWLAVLPWPEPARKRDLRAALATYGAGGALALAAIVATTAHALRLPRQTASTALLTVAAAIGVALSERALRAPRGVAGRNPAPAATAPQSRSLWLSLRHQLGRLDLIAPAHTGRWAWAGRSRFIAVSSMTLLVPFGGAAASVSMTQHRTATCFGLAIAGANIVFLLALRPGPLGSVAFRTAPLSFARAVFAVLRAPLLLAFTWFMMVASVPLATDGASWRMLPGSVAGLLLLNIGYMACAAFRPESLRQALLLYAAGLYAVAYETATGGVPYGGLALLIVCGGALLLLRRSRQHWRAFHG